MEGLYSDRLAEQVDRLAHHALHGEVWNKAFGYCRQAGMKSMERSAHREAVTFFEQALTALQHFQENRDTREQGIDVRLDLRNALQALGENEPILAYLFEAQTLAEALGDQRRLGRVFGFLAAAFNGAGSSDSAITSGHQALALATALGDMAIQVAANQHLGQAYFSLGKYRQAMEFLDKNVAALEGKRLYEHFGRLALPSVISRLFLVSCLCEIGAFPEGSAHGEEAARIAEAVEHPYSRIRAYGYLGGLSLRQGELQKAIPVLESGLSLSQVADITVVPIAPGLVLAYALSGRMAKAQKLLAQGIEQLPVWDLGGYWSPGSLLGEASLRVGQVDEALVRATRALNSAVSYRQRGYQGWALRLLGEIAALGAPPEVGQAENYYRQALALAEELGMRPLVAHCHLGLGTLYRHTEQQEQARAELSAAIELYRAMEMTFWLNPAEAALAEISRG